MLPVRIDGLPSTLEKSAVLCPAVSSLIIGTLRITDAGIHSAQGKRSGARRPMSCQTAEVTDW
ncbi:hypothetical protein BN2475_110032 [Paraburkholderia ribeironis]|uniref:Uncharacterized protein n=1 Tax=Paraburkholderia ribeironis TaxID=1247936 RepID=A0A1N7RQ95_9BURK|nr:hypothetical protein BN2475_110032 [Paraburkholderia ribeironis]